MPLSLNHLMGYLPLTDLHPRVALIKEAGEAFLQMQAAAKSDNISLNIFSGYRDFNAQNRIWQRKYLKLEKSGQQTEKIIKAILQYSAIPGTSRHHWGTEVDVVGDLNLMGNMTASNNKAEYDPVQVENYLAGGCFFEVYSWLSENAKKFDFLEVYTKDKNRSGFKFEPWHLSYQPLSKTFNHCFLSQDWIACLRFQDILGKDQLNLNFLRNYQEKYLKSINPELL